MVGGFAVLDRIEAAPADTKNENRPLEDIRILKTIVFTNPIEEANQLLMADVVESMRRRAESAVPNAVQSIAAVKRSVDESTSRLLLAAERAEANPLLAVKDSEQDARLSVGKYMSGRSAGSAAKSSEAAAAGAGAAVGAAGKRSQEEVVAAFLKSHADQGSKSADVSGSSSKKKKMGADFSSRIYLPCYNNTKSHETVCNN